MSFEKILIFYDLFNDKVFLVIDLKQAFFLNFLLNVIQVKVMFYLKYLKKDMDDYMLFLIALIDLNIFFFNFKKYFLIVEDFYIFLIVYL